jgi:hypothetical protein
MIEPPTKRPDVSPTYLEVGSVVAALLAWAGTPEESRRCIDPGTDRETTIYRASFTRDLPLTSFAATVYEFTEKHLLGSDPREWLPRHLGGGNIVELNRQQIEHGPNWHLGLK